MRIPETDSRRMRWIRNLACPCMLAVGGCAGGAWLDSASDAEFPVDSPTHSYPTAVRASHDEPTLTASSPVNPPVAQSSAAVDPASTSQQSSPSNPPVA